MITREHFTVVFLHEDNGTVSAHLPDLPGVYVSADTLGGARRGIRQALEGYLDALLGRRTSAAKAAASRANGARGGRPRKTAA